MVYGMYLSAAGALVEEARQAVIANNLANASTDGYKPDTAVFRERLTEARKSLLGRDATDPDLEGLTGGVALDEVAFSTARGAIFQTGNPLDLALRGDGFFAVTDGRRTLYTRAGSFQRSAGGELATSDGLFRALATDGRPLRLPPGEVAVGPRGEVSVDGRLVGRLLIAGSLDRAAFEKAGGNRFRHRGAGAPPRVVGEVSQGYLEGSAVNAVNEMVRLIQSHRAYETNLQMVRIQDAALGRAALELARVVA